MIKVTEVDSNRITPRDEVSLHTVTSVRVTMTAIAACVFLTSGCTPDADTVAPQVPQGSAVAGASAPATAQLTPEQNRAKAMEAVDSNPNMTPEQKAMAKKQFETMGKKQ